ncbi:MAG: LysR family transcriptional regulator, partial [Verrucomicrobia bacterium]|nr:LysR family transcriptional regulator [Verrucomicrobiota bacterium]
RWIIQLCRRAGFRPNFVQKAGSVSNMFTLIGSEGAVTLVPAYLKSFPVAGVAMVPLSDTKASWDFLVVWQRGRTGKSLHALLDALAASANAFGSGTIDS